MEQKIRNNCNYANKNFIKECLSGFASYKYLDKWLIQKSLYLKKVRLRKSKEVFYKKYKRGSLVFVDFGVNIGSELSNKHFAVVLNKFDSINNNVLTVVPITSHENKYTVKLDGLISSKSYELMLNSTQEYLQIAACIIKRMQDPDLELKMSELTKTTRELLNNTLNDLTDEKIDECLQKNNIDPNDNFSIRKFYKEILENSKLQSDITAFYEKYNKISYAKCMDIQTISKDRIQRLNRVDPVGRIAVSEDTLNKIDKAIINNFTRNLDKLN